MEHPLVRKGSIEHRLYQKKISDSARCKNTLVILPTALGKTVIASMVSSDMLYTYRDKRVLIMATTRPLVLQHLKTLSSTLKVPSEQISMVTGKTVPEARRAVWERRDLRLVFATPEVVRNDLADGRLNLRDFVLLVFDEAHRAVKDYAYTAIARQYITQSVHPVILALTASPGSDAKRIREVCENLYIEHLEYRSEDDADVSSYINPIKMKWEYCELPAEYQHIASILRSMLEEKTRWLVQRKILDKDPRWIFKRDLIEAGRQLRYRLELTQEEERIPLYWALKNQSAALSLMYCLELTESQGLYSLKAFLGRIEEDGSRTHASLLNDPRMMEIRKAMQKETEHPKIQRIVELVKEHLLDRRSKVLVFAQYRDTARHIVDLLSASGIRASRFVGQAKRQGDEGMKQEEQARVLDSFRDGTLDVLVATSIAEEGLDIPQVDLVIFYEPIPSEIRYIQRRGRTGRKTAGSVTILATKDTIDMRYLYASKRKVEKMREALLTINKILKPLKREDLRPDPLRPEEVLLIERSEERSRKIVADRLEKTRLSEQEVEALIRQEKQDVLLLESEILASSFKRQVDRATRRIHAEIQKAGRKGIGTDMLQELGMNYPVLDEALKQLEKLKRIAWLDKNTVALADSLKEAAGKTYSIYVEKVLQGKTLVIVDGKWHARLDHSDYNGPRDLLKRGAEFRAIGKLYHDDGVLNVIINKIL